MFEPGRLPDLTNFRRLRRVDLSGKEGKGGVQLEIAPTRTQMTHACPCSPCEADGSHQLSVHLSSSDAPFCVVPALLHTLLHSDKVQCTVTITCAHVSWDSLCFIQSYSAQAIWFTV